MSLWCPRYVLDLSSGLKIFLMLSLQWPFFWWKAFSKTSKSIQKGYLCSSSSPSNISRWGGTSWVCHQSFIRPSVQISRAQTKHRTVSTRSFIYLLAILMLTSQLFWGKALVITICNKSSCLRQYLQINLVIIPSWSASCCVSLRLQLIKLRLCQPLNWKHILEQNL